MRATDLVTAIGAVLVTASVYPQGSINFGNNSSTCVYCDFVNGQKVPVGTAFLAELMYAPDGTPSDIFDQEAVRIGAPASFGPVPGVFAGGARTVQYLSPAGGFGLFQVRVWESRYGASYLEVLARGAGGHAGKSIIVRVDTGDPTTVPPGTPASLVAAGLTSFSIGGLSSPYQCVPEPSTLVLAALALGILWLRRANKA